jgi:hypothetical protein
MFKRVMAFSLLLSFFSGCVAVDPEGRGYSVAIPMAIVNSTLNQNFPVERDLKYGIVSGKLNISNPTILGQSGKDKLAVGSAFKFTNVLVPDGISGEISLDSGVRYDPVSRNLYLKEPMVKEIKFQEESLLQKLPDGIKKAIGDIVAQTIAKKPIYNLKQSTIISGFVRGIDVRNGQIYLTFGL